MAVFDLMLALGFHLPDRNRRLSKQLDCLLSAGCRWAPHAVVLRCAYSLQRYWIIIETLLSNISDPTLFTVLHSLFTFTCGIPRKLLKKPNFSFIFEGFCYLTIDIYLNLLWTGFTITLKSDQKMLQGKETFEDQTWDRFISDVNKIIFWGILYLI